MKPSDFGHFSEAGLDQLARILRNASHRPAQDARTREGEHHSAAGDVAAGSGEAVKKNRRCFACKKPSVAHLCMPCIELVPIHMIQAVVIYSGPALLHVALWVRYLRLERGELLGADRG